MTTALIAQRELTHDAADPATRCRRRAGSAARAQPAAPGRDLRGVSRAAGAGLRPATARCPTPPPSRRDPPSLWRYREWLPFDGEPALSLDSGFTPLVEAPALARRLGVARLWIKNDSVCHPSLSFKDRVVASAINAAPAFGLDTVGCASTGNLANAVAAQAARAGPRGLDLHPPRSRARQGRRHRGVQPAPGARPRHLRRRQPALHPGGRPVRLGPRQHQPARLLRRGLQDRRLRDLRAARLAHADRGGGAHGGRLAGDQAGEGVRRVRQGRAGVRARRPGSTAPRPTGARRSCGWWKSGGEQIEPVIPNTIARSIAIGNPADGRFAAAGDPRHRWLGRRRHATRTWWPASGSSPRPRGIFTETAGGATVAGALALARAGRLGPEDEVVLCITGNGLKTIEALEGALPEAPLIAPKHSRTGGPPWP